MRSSNLNYEDVEDLLLRVGARQEVRHPPQQGGRYLDNCTNFESLDMADFYDAASKIGLSPMLIELIDDIGLEAALKSWKFFSEQSDHRNILYVPAFSSWRRLATVFLAWPLKERGLGYRKINQLLRESGYEINRNAISRMTQKDYENVCNLFESIKCSSGGEGTAD